jgi:hypothetical protein
MVKKKLKLGILVMVLVFGMTVVGCFEEEDISDQNTQSQPQPGASASNPIDRVESTNLGTMTSSASGWRYLLNSIDSAGKYINLDLSACTMTDEAFNPDSSVETGKKYIVSIILPTAATSIEAGTYSNPTFKNFTNLKSASGANIITIGDYSFLRETGGGYSYLQDGVEFPKATTIGAGAFRDTYLESVKFPLVTDIGDSAFSGLSSKLKNADFPVVETIGEGAFSFCSDLESISFPASAKLGYSSYDESYSNPFTSCEKVSFTLSGTGSLSVIEDGKALVRDNTILLAYPSASGNITINNITALDGKVFKSCYDLESVSLPQVTSIGSETFAYCTNIQVVSFQQATSIGSEAFSNCSRLQSASFPLVTTIGSYAFSYCSALVSVNIPKVTEIGAMAFTYTGTAALSITMGSTAPTLGRSIFFLISTTKTVTVKVPTGASGYTPFTGTAVTVSGTNNTANWANGFRGGGWNGSSFAQYSELNQNISVIIQQQ